MFRTMIVFVFVDVAVRVCAYVCVCVSFCGYACVCSCVFGLWHVSIHPLARFIEFNFT